MADTAFTNATQILEPFKGVKKVTLEEYFTPATAPARVASRPW